LPILRKWLKDGLFLHCYHQCLDELGRIVIPKEIRRTLRKMIALAIDGITSLSVKPLQLISSLGILVSMISFIGVIWAVISNLCGNTVAGWASTVCVVCFVAGIQLVCLGVIGEYVGKIYMEVKHRPRYIISDRTEEEKKDS